MAIWTQADIDKVRAAVVALAAGEAVQSIRLDGPPERTVTYHPAELEKAKRMLAEMEADNARAEGRRVSARYAYTKKGF